MIDSLKAIMEHIEMAQDALLGMDPEDAMTSLNSAKWLTEDLLHELGYEFD